MPAYAQTPADTPALSISVGVPALIWSDPDLNALPGGRLGLQWTAGNGALLIRWGFESGFIPLNFDPPVLSACLIPLNLRIAAFVRHNKGLSLGLSLLFGGILVIGDNEVRPVYMTGARLTGEWEITGTEKSIRLYAETGIDITPEYPRSIFLAVAEVGIRIPLQTIKEEE
ncbi:hypothetical protein AGMMS49928_00310 [Spirochaetia bacterium]|nr:hypothetical protein AGMMS49928_00310 [Spirochaetia bacterium]